MFRLAVAMLLLTTGWNATDPGIVAVGPNPVAMNDRGEYVVLAVPENTSLEGLTITDGETVVRLPDETVSGRVALSEEPGLLDPWMAIPVFAFEGRLALANVGDELVLRRDGAVLDRVAYRRAPEGRRYVRTDDGWRWRREGWTDFPPVRATPERAQVFVLPDAPNATLHALANADHRILLGAYTFASPRTATALCRARERGVTVRVLADGGPVGGLTRRSAAAFETLSTCGVDVTILGGPHARYAFHHAKYAVIDDRVLALTENWKPSGAGGRANRGWGVIVDSPTLADGLAEIFAADTGWRDGVDWREYRVGRSFEPAPVANGTFPATHRPAAVPVSNVSLLVTPDNAEPAIVALFDGATDSIDVQQVSIGDPTSPLVAAAIRAARRGVRVRLLLSSAWYVREENRARAEALTELARRENLPLEVRLTTPAGRYGKLHSKGVVIDAETAVVGSINWNNNSLRRNRELAVVLRGSAVAAYYQGVFVSDWRGGQWLITVGVIGAALGTFLAAALWTRRSFAFDASGAADRLAAFPDEEAP